MPAHRSARRAWDRTECVDPPDSRRWVVVAVLVGGLLTGCSAEEADDPAGARATAGSPLGPSAPPGPDVAPEAPVVTLSRDPVNAPPGFAELEDVLSHAGQGPATVQLPETTARYSQLLLAVSCASGCLRAAPAERVAGRRHGHRRDRLRRDPGQLSDAASARSCRSLAARSGSPRRGLHRVCPGQDVRGLSLPRAARHGRGAASRAAPEVVCSLPPVSRWLGRS